MSKNESSLIKPEFDALVHSVGGALFEREGELAEINRISYFFNYFSVCNTGVLFHFYMRDASSIAPLTLKISAKRMIIR